MADRIVVTNVHRNQPVLFHVFGGSVRLGPGESRELDAHCLSSPELTKLVGTGRVTTQAAPPAERAAVRPGSAAVPAQGQAAGNTSAKEGAAATGASEAEATG